MTRCIPPERLRRVRSDLLRSYRGGTVLQATPILRELSADARGRVVVRAVQEEKYSCTVRTKDGSLLTNVVLVYPADFSTPRVELKDKARRFYLNMEKEPKA